MASRSVNKVILVGHLGKDAETKFTPSGVAVSKFSVATNRRWKDQQTGEWKEETDWANVVLWRGENVATYLTRGKQVYVEGRLQSRSYDDKDGKKVYVTEVVADDVILLSGNAGQKGGPDAPFPDDEYSNMASMPRSAQRARTNPVTPITSGGPSGPSAEPALGGGITDDDVPF
jgi:single-strand DNA-binding protein